MFNDRLFYQSIPEVEKDRMSVKVGALARDQYERALFIFRLMLLSCLRDIDHTFWSRL